MIEISDGADGLYALSVDLEVIKKKIREDQLNIAVVDSHIQQFTIQKNAYIHSKNDLLAKESAIKDMMAAIILKDRSEKEMRNCHTYRLRGNL